MAIGVPVLSVTKYEEDNINVLLGISEPVSYLLALSKV